MPRFICDPPHLGAIIPITDTPQLAPDLSPNAVIDLTTPLAPPQFVLDNVGNCIAAVLSIASYERLMDAFEELQDIAESERMHDAIARGEEEVIPFDQAMAEMTPPGRVLPNVYRCHSTARTKTT